MKQFVACLTVLAALLIPQQMAAQAGFVHAEGKFLVDGSGHRLILKGTNLGNWLVQEGYMFRLDHGPSSAREIEALVNELIGPTQAEEFWHKYREGYISREDIDYISSLGFNTIRIPFHYRFFEEGNDEGFRLIDRVVEWAAAGHMYVVLDMHCAPGGQTGSNIDDSWGYPWLFEDPASQEKTALIWRRIAAHYKDNKTVIGYDLLNEPIPHYPALQKYNDRLEPLYRKITSAIREVDQNHVIILGGARWDTNFSVFGPPFDKNLIYQFHKYWMQPVKGEIQEYLDFRDKYNVPIWMGESGENTDDWIAKFRTLLDENEVNWTFWPYKKMDSPRSPVTFAQPVHWSEIVKYAARHSWTGDSENSIRERPSLEDSRAAFADLLVQIKFENRRINPGYLEALGAKVKPGGN